MKELEYLVGTWKMEGELDGQEWAATTSYQWARGGGKKKYCLTTNWMVKYGGKNFPGVSIVAWNAAKKELTECGFNVAGDYFMTRWTIKSSTEWRGEFLDVRDGQEFKGKAEVTKKGPTKFIYESQRTTGETARIVCEKVTKERKGKRERAKKGREKKSPAKKITPAGRQTFSSGR